MVLQKYNAEKKEYEEYKVSDNWNVTTFSYDMKEIVNCAQCGRELPYGKCYTSLEVHTELGMGYAVCDGCYEAERSRRKKYKQD